MKRSELKVSAKGHLKGNVLIIFITAIVMILVFSLAAVIPFGGILILPIFIGFSYIYLQLSKNKGIDIGDVFNGFRNELYGRNLGSIILQYIFNFLWFFVFIIPGFVKIFSYAMVPFVLSDKKFNKLSATEAITKSRELMNGNKFRYLILQLSFILWIIPVVLTVGIALIYVIPYMGQTRAEFYNDIKKKA